MSRETYPQLAHKRRSFLSTLAVGCCSIVIVGIFCGTTVGLYGMSIIDRKTGNIFEFTQQVVENLPEYASSLPPAIADILNDTRSPEYASNITVSGRMTPHGKHGDLYKPTIEVTNDGEELVSLLSLHVVILDEDGNVVTEYNDWAATPIACEQEWRGPLLPGAHRRMTSNHGRVRTERNADRLRVEIEITDVRIWTQDDATDVALTATTSTL